VCVHSKSSLQPKSSLVPSNSTRMADPRNISDKAFLSNSIKQLINFLSERGYPEMISPKILSRPSNRDFMNICIFAFRQLDPNLQFGGKIEDDIVAMFKLIGYPVNISKSNIAAPGTPHAWPSLLAALVWLIDLINYGDASRIGDITTEEDGEDENVVGGSGGSFDERATDKLFQQYLRSAYPLFLRAQDDKVDELEQELVNKFAAHHQLLDDEVVSYEQRLTDVQREIEAIEAKRAYMPILQQKLSDYMKDREKFEQHVRSLVEHRDQLNAKTAAREAELEKLAMSVGALNGEIQTLKDKIATQELSPEDVKRMQAEHGQLQQSLEAASEQRQANQRKVWELEMQLRDRVQGLDDTGKQYNSVAEDLKLVPSTARNARGKHLAIEVDTRAKRREDLLRTDVHKDILPTLQGLKLELSENTTALKSELLTESESNEEVESGLTELTEQLRVAESKLKRMEDAIKREKESLDMSQQAHDEEKEALERQIDTLRDGSAEEARVTNIVRRIEKLKAERELRAHAHNENKIELMNAIMDVVTACAAHREMVQQGLGDLKNKYSDCLEKHLLSTQGNAALSASMGPAGLAQSQRFQQQFAFVESANNGSLIFASSRNNNFAMPPAPPAMLASSYSSVVNNNLDFEASGRQQRSRSKSPGSGRLSLSAGSNGSRLGGSASRVPVASASMPQNNENMDLNNSANDVSQLSEGDDYRYEVRWPILNASFSYIKYLYVLLAQGLYSGYEEQSQLSIDLPPAPTPGSHGSSSHGGNHKMMADELAMNLSAIIPDPDPVRVSLSAGKKVKAVSRNRF
jgi:kinetochore protein NDC80